jgi:hypothetical protein
MERPDDSPPPYLGDYPDGAHWSALRPDGSIGDDGVEDFTVVGTSLRMLLRWT